MEKKDKCLICKNDELNYFVAFEKMYGTKKKFRYYECKNCGMLRICIIPEDIASYYPSDYYSFRTSNSIIQKIKDFLILYRDKYLLQNKKTLIGKIVANHHPMENLDDFHYILKNINLDNSTVLDIGSGSGNFLKTLANIGFTKNVGVDPFIEKDIITKQYKVFKKSLSDLVKEDVHFDNIFSTHSLEHMPNQEKALMQMKKLLKNDNSSIILSIPIKTNYVWEKYGINWVQLDVPRHVCIQTLKSFKILLHKVGLKIQNYKFNSKINLFLGSELYLRGLPLCTNGKSNKNIFSNNEIINFSEELDSLNEQENGDQIICILKKT
ncbi:hypothetical protein NEF87_004302 [Candidatus Lokiarchaeum ossiferum]|uniref:Class I SAM-dependent methyltransferase n=1 Tax=Candidatus Lokiarchaeum ossiferum TaxID=2951803 RepID=A0ABY6HWX7_9ARCH|nr:hypothetical protein NEF87_004302 [Candidatus Lokiarchaeum sp. B-35]